MRCARPVTALEDLQHPRFARWYAWLSAAAERNGFAAHRARLVAGLRGRVLEIGAGNGLTFAHYPPEVELVVAVEPDDHLRGLARAAAESAPVPVRLVRAHVDDLPAEAVGADAAVCSLVLCSVPDQARALAAVRHALRPGGELRFLEHVRSDARVARAVEHAVAPVWSRVLGGCRPDRDTLGAVGAAGFVVEDVERFRLSPLPGQVHVRGSARVPSG